MDQETYRMVWRAIKDLERIAEAAERIATALEAPAIDQAIVDTSRLYDQP